MLVRNDASFLYFSLLALISLVAVNSSLCDVQVFGISGDSPEENKAFKQAQNLPYDLLTDENNILRKEFGIPNAMMVLPGALHKPLYSFSAVQYRCCCTVEYIADKQTLICKCFQADKRT